MPAKRKNLRKKPPRKLFLGEWLDRLGYSQVDVAKRIEVTESYLSELINNKKKNPNINYLLEISDYIGISVNAMFSPPPPLSAIQQFQGLSRDAIERLGRTPHP